LAQSGCRRVELAGETLELLAQLLVAEDLLECRSFELLDGLEGRRAVPHQIAELEARLDRLIGVVGDAEIVGRTLASLRNLLALLQEVSPVAFCCLFRELLALAVSLQRPTLIGPVLSL